MKQKLLNRLVANINQKKYLRFQRTAKYKILY